jgi:integrase
MDSSRAKILNYCTFIARREAEPVSRERRSFGRLRKLPSGRYQAAYIGPDEQLHTASETFAAKLDAEAWLTDRRREIDRELWSPPGTSEQKKAKRKADLTFADYSEKWLRTRTTRGRALRPRTTEAYQNILRDHLLPTFGKKAVRSISMESVDRWYAHTAVDTPTMRAHAYSLLRTIMETARTRDRLIDVNPCAIRGAGSVKRAVTTKTATLAQLDTITAEMPERLQPMVLLAAWCAMRFGELAELRRGDVHVNDGVVSIKRGVYRVTGRQEVGSPKSDAGIRDVAIPPNILPMIKAHLASEHVDPRKDALLFPAKSGGHLQPSTFYRHYYKARAKAERPDLRFHDLRHTGATMAAQAGATLADLMARGGWSTPAAAMRYQHAAEGRDKALAAAMAKMAEAETAKA